MPDGPSRFAYVTNSPLMYIDPTGEFLNFAIGVGIGIGLEYYFNPCATPADLLKAGALGAFGGGYVKGLQHANKLRKLGKFAKAGKQADKNGLTKAGRGLQKHGDRAGSKFPKATGKANQKNKQGQQQLEDILGSSDKVIYKDKFGRTVVRDNKTGKGVRFNEDGSMRGFLD